MGEGIIGLGFGVCLRRRVSFFCWFSRYFVRARRGSRADSRRTREREHASVCLSFIPFFSFLSVWCRG
jgi:hypothetical protein